MTGSAAKRCTFCCRAIALKWEGVPGEGWHFILPGGRLADLFFSILGDIFQGYFKYPFFSNFYALGIWFWCHFGVLNPLKYQ